MSGLGNIFRSVGTETYSPDLFGLENRSDEWVGRRTCSFGDGIGLGVSSMSQPAFRAGATPYTLELYDYCYRLRTSPNNSSQLRPHLLPSKATDSDRLLGVVT